MKSEALEATEAECSEGRTAPRVSLDDIKSEILFECYCTGAQAATSAGAAECPDSLGVLTLCIITMRNGFTIVGKSAPASAENFDSELGRKLAYEDAVRQIWPLMGFALRQKLHEGN